MPYCPSCRAEYKEGVDVCPECEWSLSPALEKRESQEETRDVYLCHDDQLAERVRILLEERGIGALVRDRSARDFPTHVSDSNSQIVAVAAHDYQSARAVLQGAIDDDVVPADAGRLA